jgi:3-oxoadipate enol-lactonase
MDQWGSLPARLAAEYRVLLVNLRGHGNSPPAQAGYSMADYAADVEATMRRQKIGPAIVIGLSFGGMIAQRLAVSNPDLVSALVLCGCPASIPQEASETMRERGREAERCGMEAVIEATLTRWFTSDFRSDDAVAVVADCLRRRDPADWSAAWHAIADFAGAPGLEQIDAPALVVAGECDASIPVTSSRLLAEKLPNAELVVIPGAPHMMQIESSAAFAGLISAFAARLRARPGL